MNRHENLFPPSEYPCDLVREHIGDFLEQAERRREIEGIVGDMPLARLRELVEADQLIGKEIWAKENTFHMFWKDTGNVGRAGVQYVSILKNGDIFLHTQTCAIPFREIGKTVFLSRESAEAALKGEQDGRLY